MIECRTRDPGRANPIHVASLSPLKDQAVRRIGPRLRLRAGWLSSLTSNSRDRYHPDSHTRPLAWAAKGFPDDISFQALELRWSAVDRGSGSRFHLRSTRGQ